jgi:signal transduction histidine kinase
MKTRAQKGGVQISCSETLDHTAIRGDGRAIQQIIHHVLSNAVKFTPPGGIVTVSAGIAPEGGLAVVVQDTGVGISEDVQHRLFEPFYQADASTRRQFDGTGLGLTISHRLLALHGGSLSIESVHGQGTTVRIVFPRTRVAASSFHEEGMHSKH